MQYVLLLVFISIFHSRRQSGTWAKVVLDNGKVFSFSSKLPTVPNHYGPAADQLHPRAQPQPLRSRFKLPPDRERTE